MYGYVSRPMTLRFLFLSLLALSWSLTGLAASEPQLTDHLRSQLVAAETAAQPGRTLDIGLLFEHDEHWHTYWVNPGDSGLKTEVELTLPEGVSASGIQWPAPQRFLLGELVNFGYDGRTLLPMQLTIPADYAASTLPITVSARWLICEHECIPGKADYRFELPVANAAEPDSRWAEDFAKARARQPQSMDIAANISEHEDNTLQMTLNGADLPENLSDWTLFPIAEELIAYGPLPQWQPAGQGWQTALTRSDYYQRLPETSDWLLVQGDRALRFTATASSAEAANAIGASQAVAVTDESEPTLFLALGLALLGGLILNLMPCVFPVLSLKAMAAVRSADNRAALRHHGLWYTAGVVVSFVAVAGLLLVLRAGGEQLGWGFQMQSPWFVALMALLLFALGLSFSGVWEFGGRFAGVGQGLTEGHGAKPAFFTGVLAVVVASPCTAPFMGTALGFAISQPPVWALSVFVALGLGLALPMLLLGFVPALARLLPKPGAWMTRFRQVLAFPLYLTVVWLLWVYGEQTSALSMAWLLAALTALAFGLWLWNQRHTMQSTGSKRFSAALSLLALIGAVALPLSSAEQAVPAAQPSNQAWSAERLSELTARGEPVLVNMTAAWCLTCLANERVALRDELVQSLIAERGIHYLKGDWTRYDADITQYLEQFGRNGVPLYVYYPRGGGEPQVLPQLLTPDLLLTTLAEGGQPPKPAP